MLYMRAGFGGVWGMLAVGIFGAKDELEGLLSHNGILHGGGFYLFGVQLLACCCFAVWASSCTFVLIWVSISWNDLLSSRLTHVHCASMA